MDIVSAFMSLAQKSCSRGSLGSLGVALTEDTLPNVTEDEPTAASALRLQGGLRVERKKKEGMQDHFLSLKGISNEMGFQGFVTIV